MYARFPGFSLKILAESLGVTNKTKGGRFVVSLVADEESEMMMRYNYNDCVVLREICEKLNIINEIIALCEVSRSPFDDVSVYSTRIMAWNKIISCGVTQGIRYMWPKTPVSFIPIKGAHVIFERPRLVRFNYCLDYKSLYPSVIIGGAISPESAHIMRCVSNEPHTMFIHES